MPKKYIFIMNSTKPSTEELESFEGNFINNFNKPCIESAISLGYEVYLGVNKKYPEKLTCPEYAIQFYDSNTFRNLFNIKDNWKAYKNLAYVLKKGNVEVIHCNTPIGGMVGRLCGRRYHVPKIIYTAHGFHFFKGAPLFNRTLLKWAEKVMAHWTDVLITMNEEDYREAKKFKLKKDGKVYKIPGVGIDTTIRKDLDICEIKNLRSILQIKENDLLCIAMGDLVKRKNYPVAIEAIAKSKNSNIHYLICGEGPEKDNLIKLSRKLNVENQIHFLGYRSDVKKLLMISDFLLFSSIQEGLPRSVLEAMACGLPCIVSNIRGNNDLIKNNINGFLFEPKDSNGLVHIINRIAKDKDLRERLGKANLNEIEKYDITIVKEIIQKIYEDNIGKEEIS